MPERKKKAAKLHLTFVRSFIGANNMRAKVYLQKTSFPPKNHINPGSDIPVQTFGPANQDSDKKEY